MEEPSSGVKGRIKLPIGYRFCPTDEELLSYYLKRKVLSQPLPISIIPEFDVFQSEPWGLPAGSGNCKDKLYFFSKGKGLGFGNLGKKAAGSGFWKVVGKDKAVVVSGTNKVIGVKKALIFCEGRRLSPESNRRWLMNEFRLAAGYRASSYPSQIVLSDWAVYQIHQVKKPKLKTNGNSSNSTNAKKPDAVQPFVMDFTVEDPMNAYPPPPCSPSLSEGSDSLRSLD